MPIVPEWWSPNPNHTEFAHSDYETAHGNPDRPPHGSPTSPRSMADGSRSIKSPSNSATDSGRPNAAPSPPQFGEFRITIELITNDTRDFLVALGDPGVRRAGLARQLSKRRAVFVIGDQKSPLNNPADLLAPVVTPTASPDVCGCHLERLLVSRSHPVANRLPILVRGVVSATICPP